MGLYRVEYDAARGHWTIVGPASQVFPIRFAVEEHARDFAAAMNAAIAARERARGREIA